MRRHQFLLSLMLLMSAAAASVHGEVSHTETNGSEQPRALVLTASETEIRVTGITPGSTAVLFGLVLGNHRGYSLQYTVEELLIDADGDGMVTFSPLRGVPLRSIWTTVDLANGARGVGVRPDYPLELIAFPFDGVKRDSDETWSGLIQQRTSLEVLVVRPREGAWRISAREGGAGDQDRQNDGRLNIAFEGARQLSADSPKLKHLKNDDVLIGIDGNRMQLFLTTVGKR